MTRKARILAMLTAIMLLAVMLSSALFIAAEAEHECTHEHCPVCRQIAACENTLRLLFTVAVVAKVCVLSALSLVFFAPQALCRQEHNTLISLKVKLSD